MSSFANIVSSNGTSTPPNYPSVTPVTPVTPATSPPLIAVISTDILNKEVVGSLTITTRQLDGSSTMNANLTLIYYPSRNTENKEPPLSNLIIKCVKKYAIPDGEKHYKLYLCRIIGDENELGFFCTIENDKYEEPRNTSFSSDYRDIKKNVFTFTERGISQNVTLKIIPNKFIFDDYYKHEIKNNELIMEYYNILEQNIIIPPSNTDTNTSQPNFRGGNKTIQEPLYDLISDIILGRLESPQYSDVINKMHSGFSSLYAPYSDESEILDIHLKEVTTDLKNKPFDISKITKIAKRWDKYIKDNLLSDKIKAKAYNKLMKLYQKCIPDTQKIPTNREKKDYDKWEYNVTPFKSTLKHVNFYGLPLLRGYFKTYEDPEFKNKKLSCNLENKIKELLKIIGYNAEYIKGGYIPQQYYPPRNQPQYPPQTQYPPNQPPPQYPPNQPLPQYPPNQPQPQYPPRPQYPPNQTQYPLNQPLSKYPSSQYPSQPQYLPQPPFQPQSMNTLQYQQFQPQFQSLYPLPQNLNTDGTGPRKNVSFNPNTDTRYLSSYENNTQVPRQGPPLIREQPQLLPQPPQPPQPPAPPQLLPLPQPQPQISQISQLLQQPMSPLRSTKITYRFAWKEQNTKLYRYNGYFYMEFETKDKVEAVYKTSMSYRIFCLNNYHKDRIIKNVKDKSHTIVVVNKTTKEIQIFVCDKINLIENIYRQTNNSIIAEISENKESVYVLFDANVIKATEIKYEPKYNNEFEILKLEIKKILDRYISISDFSDLKKVFEKYSDLEEILEKYKDNRERNRCMEIYKTELELRIDICSLVFKINKYNNIIYYMNVLRDTKNNIGNVSSNPADSNLCDRIQKNAEIIKYNIPSYGSGFIYD